MLHRSADGPIDRPYHLGILRGDQGERISAAFGPAGSTDAVNIGLGGGGDVEIDDMGNIGDIDAAGGDIRGHQNLIRSGAEAVECCLAPPLGQVALQ